MPEPLSPHPDEATLGEYLDGVLDTSAQARIESHLAGCPSCATRAAEMRALFAALQALPDLPLERDLATSVLAAVRAPAAPSPVLRLALAVQSLISLILLIVAWPSLERQATLLASAALSAQAIAAVWNAMDRLSDQASVWLASADAQIAQVMELVRRVPAINLAHVVWWPLLVSASLLWLVGNGLLVYPAIAGDARRQRRSSSQAE